MKLRGICIDMKILLGKRIRKLRDPEKLFSEGLDTATEQELWNILQGKNDADKRAVAYSKNVTEEMLEFLMDSNDWQIKSHIAISPYTPEYMLQELSESHSPGVRKRVAQNLHTPIPVLQELVTDPINSVNRAARETLELLKY